MGEQQAARRVVMVRPTRYGTNSETASSNAFQHEHLAGDADATALAQSEFDALASELRRSGVEVVAVDDSVGLPDSVFPNNWFSWHEDESGLTIVLYPMLSEARRRERDEIGVLDLVCERLGMRADRVIDLTAGEESGRFLEGTGSLVLDRTHRLAFACRSQRTDEDLVWAFCDQLGYEPMLFDAADRDGLPIYHTNVLMWIGSSLAGVCTDTISGESDRDRVLQTLNDCGKCVVELSYEQMCSFAGNAIELRGENGPVLAMSAAAHASLRKDQLGVIEADLTIVSSPIPTIEHLGGGSVRCMIAEAGG